MWDCIFGSSSAFEGVCIGQVLVRATQHDRHTETGYDRKVTLKAHAEATSTAKEEPEPGPSKHSSKHYSNNEALGSEPEASSASSSSINVDVVQRAPRKSAVVDSVAQCWQQRGYRLRSTLTPQYACQPLICIRRALVT